MAKKIIVIGSGFGGLAAALRLKAKGYEVTLVEKHPDLGGRARVFKKGDFVSYKPSSEHSSFSKKGCLLLVFLRKKNKAI